VSHLHGDHFLDLVPMVVALRFHPNRAGRRVTLIAPDGVVDRLTAASGEPSSHLALSDVFDIAEPTDRALGPFQLRFQRMKHTVPDYGVRLEHGGRSLVYSGDTAPCDELTDLASAASVALFEAGWPAGTDESLGIHLTPGQAARQARDAGAERLILTHMVPWSDREAARAEASAIFNGPVHVAAAGDVVEV
jgi:ribonuclease BN (tRNA processing enzyme)